MIEHVSPPASMLREAAQRASAPTVRSSDAERAEGHPGVFRGTTAVATAKERGLWVAAVTFPGNSLAC